MSRVEDVNLARSSTGVPLRVLVRIYQEPFCVYLSQLLRVLLFCQHAPNESHMTAFRNEACYLNLISIRSVARRLALEKDLTTLIPNFSEVVSKFTR